MKFNFKVIEHRKKYIIISLIFVVLSLGMIFFKGLNYGIDFSGGNLFQMQYKEKQLLWMK